MYQKNCNKCRKNSYSSSEFGEWLCPVCGNDLTNETFLDAMTLQPIHITYKKRETPDTYSIKIKKTSNNYRKRVGLSYYSKKSSTISRNFL